MHIHVSKCSKPQALRVMVGEEHVVAARVCFASRELALQYPWKNSSRDN